MDPFISIRDLTHNCIKNKELKITTISKSTIHNRLIKNGIVNKHPTYKHILTENQMLKRLLFAKQHYNFNWDNRIFSDETTISLNYNRRKIWIPKDNKLIVPIKKHPYKKHIWNSIIKNKNMTIKIFRGIMDSEVYIDILTEKLVPLYESLCSTDIYPIFQSDNDPKHTSKYAKNNLSYMMIPTLDWPSSSPDLNPIENIWKLLKENVNKRRPSNALELEKYIEEETSAINIETINNIINSMSKRISETIKNNGGYTSY